jgi:hypothetical protein
MQIETLRLIHAHAGGKVLVICPLGVRQEFKRDAQMLGVRFEFIRRESEMTPDCDFTSRTMSPCATESWT